MIRCLAILCTLLLFSAHPAWSDPTIACGFTLEIPNCDPKQDCTQPQDTRDCTRCVATLLGNCLGRFDDPLCEKAKSSQNAIYDSNRAVCEMEKDAQRRQCEANKASVLKLQQQIAEACKPNHPDASIQPVAPTK
ncbi:hypothetical protein EB235_08190 [Mesorhizobium loti R88b]|uniref:Uncharacterized protein n=1 Tax=Mesorhizobium loti R88b TaxID=935548 RepID=A0A6M7WKX9_RHILI|nr:hypothetical protein EB235_08190 [Mesorhizobium loti R88b]